MASSLFAKAAPDGRKKKNFSLGESHLALIGEGRGLSQAAPPIICR